MKHRRAAASPGVYVSGARTILRVRLLAANTALTPIHTGRLPVAVAITPDGKTAYAVNTFWGNGDSDPSGRE